MDVGYVKHFTPNGNEYDVHSTHTGQGLLKNIPFAEFIIDKLKLKVTLLPDNTKNIETWKLLMPEGTKLGKHPDALINGEIWEFKTVESDSINALKRNISDAYKQADNIFICFNHQLSNKKLYRYIKGEILATKNMQKVWVLKNGKLINSIVCI